MLQLRCFGKGYLWFILSLVPVYLLKTRPHAFCPPEKIRWPLDGGWSCHAACCHFILHICLSVSLSFVLSPATFLANVSQSIRHLLGGLVKQLKTRGTSLTKSKYYSIAFGHCCPSLSCSCCPRGRLAHSKEPRQEFIGSEPRFACVLNV
ncbi:hypothetical protein BX600DRAFT_130293 [Xylariales sp. PMI_506]|nr:hypothetical protein BX600DRAFT_130293 [Xylariales sp. PMI_506]